MVLLAAVCLLFLFYAILILYYRNGWRRLVAQTDQNVGHLNTDGSIFFSVVIPARNEAENIKNCVTRILEQDYPRSHFEVIVVDDFSEDDTAGIVADLKSDQLLLIRMSERIRDKIGGGEKVVAHKKRGIEEAIKMAKGNWIVTTDADCIVPATWLKSLSAHILQSNADFVAAPVDYVTGSNALSVFQSLDFMTLQGITGAAAFYKAHVLCNGANLAYKKAIFLELGGFKNIDHIASGDDMLLMNKFYVNRKEGISYLLDKAAIVKTFPMSTLKGFLHQRIRWASKSAEYKDPVIFSVLLLVYFFNLLTLVLMFWSIWQPQYWIPALLIIFLKALVEIYFLFPVASFFGKRRELWFFFPAQPFHIVYTVVAGWLGKFGSYEWKGRNNVVNKPSTYTV